MSTTENAGRWIVSAQVTLSERDRLRELATAGDRPLSAEIRRAIREHLKNTDERTTSWATTQS